MAGPIFSNGPLPRWSDGERRVVLIGHGYGTGASGAALAMEDALLLARMLKREQSAIDDTQTLSRIFRDFEAKRRPRVERIGNAAEARNDSRLIDQGYWCMKAKEYVMWIYGWWYGSAYYDASSAYKVEDL